MCVSSHLKWLPKTAFRLCTAAILLPGSMGLLRAQSAEDLNSALKPLTAHAQDVIKQLGTLNHLPDGDWRYHIGDLPHGESLTLDDAAWQQTHGHTDAPKDAVWYRKWIEVPKSLNGYDLTGTRIWFQFHADIDDNAPQILYFNGRRVASGADLEPAVLFENAKAGDEVLVAVKLPQTVDTKAFNGATLKIDFAENRSDPSDLRQQAIAAAFLIPSLSKNVASDDSILDKALNDVDLKALDGGDQTHFDAGLKLAQSDLDALKPLLAQDTFHLTGNSHIDAAWLWPWTETVDVVKRTFGTALQLMNEYPSYTYTQSAAQYNEWLAQKYPDLNDQIKQRVKEGRWEVVGGMWVEPDLNMPDGESLTRALLLGKRWYQKEYGVDVRIGWNPDSFGYNWQLPQIHKKADIDYFMTQKMSWSDTNRLPFKLFWWESPDGSKVLTYFPHGYDNKNLTPSHLGFDLSRARQQAPGLDRMMDLYGVGDHGGGPTRSMLDEGMHWADANTATPKYHFGTAISFFQDVQRRIASDSTTWDYDSIAQGYKAPDPVEGKIAIPTWKDELYLEYHRGVFTTQAAHKRNMRESEEWAINAEKFAALAWLDGNAYPSEQLNDAWKKIVFNDFHDLAAGSGIGIIYKDAQSDFDQVRWATSEISQDALNTLSSDIDTAKAGAIPVLVFNPLAWQRNGVVDVKVQLPEAAHGEVSVLDAANQVLPSSVVASDDKTNSYELRVVVDHVPSLGYKVLHVVPGKKFFASDLKVQGLTLENTALKVSVDPQTGCISSLYSKAAQKETIAANSCGNELEAFKDTPKDFDAWNIDPGALDVPPTRLTSAGSVRLIENTPLRAVIRVSRDWQKSKFVQDIILYTGADHVVVDNDIDWHEQHILLKAAFPLVQTSAKATYEIPYGTIERATTRTNSWDKARFEVPALRWADLGNAQAGLSLINESKYGYDVVDNLLRLSLLRSPTSPDPIADQGRHHFRYEIYPHAGDWKQALTVRHGYEFNYALDAQQVVRHAGTLGLEHSYASVEPENVVLTALKKAEDSDALVYRVYEWAGKAVDVHLHVPAGATSAEVVNLIERPTGQQLAATNGEVTIPVHPYEILTVRVVYPHASK